MRLSVLVPALLLVSVPTLSAQVTLRPGQRIRITASSLGVERQAATLVTQEEGVLVVTADTTLRVPRIALERVDVFAGRRSHPWRGAGVGFLAGAVTGFALWLVAVEGCYEGVPESACAAVYGGFFGGLSGALIGAAIGGFLVHTDRWERVPLDRVWVGLVPLPDRRLGLGASIPF